MCVVNKVLKILGFIKGEVKMTTENVSNKEFIRRFRELVPRVSELKNTWSILVGKYERAKTFGTPKYNDSDEFSWTWNVPDSLNKIFPLCLKMLLHFKKRQVFWRTLYLHYLSRYLFRLLRPSLRAAIQ
jgi:hypothetical protein